LDELGVKVRMAHPKEVKSIAEAKVKTDKRGLIGISFSAGLAERGEVSIC
jgi:hypothetical protein